MRLAWFAVLLALPPCLAQGLAVSPAQLTLEEDGEASLWLANPNSHAIDVRLQSDCGMPDADQLHLAAGQRTTLSVAGGEQCSGALTISLSMPDADALAVIPRIQVPIAVAGVQKTFLVHQALPDWNPAPAASPLKGVLLSVSIVVVGVAGYLAQQRLQVGWRHRKT